VDVEVLAAGERLHQPLRDLVFLRDPLLCEADAAMQYLGILKSKPPRFSLRAMAPRMMTWTLRSDTVCVRNPMSSIMPGVCIGCALTFAKDVLRKRLVSGV
jgi:hypothetical protein